MQPFQQNKSLHNLSTFGIGGKAQFFTEVKTSSELQEVLSHCYFEKLPFHVIGKGSNSLFSDQGYNGLVIHNKISFCDISDVKVSVGAGYSFSLLGSKTARKGLSGLEFASGIPASVGGAIFMNAGASGSETFDVLDHVIFVDETGSLKKFSASQLDFSYRYSSFHKMNGVIAEAHFTLKKAEEARQKQLDIVAYRTKTQPYGDKSCGCIFRNPEGESAGMLIEKCGLKGKQIGGAKVSTVHANFIINKKNARAEDVIALANHIRDCVKEMTGINLVMELRQIPFALPEKDME